MSDLEAKKLTDTFLERIKDEVKFEPIWIDTIVDDRIAYIRDVLKELKDDGYSIDFESMENAVTALTFFPENNGSFMQISKDNRKYWLSFNFETEYKYKIKEQED